MDQLFDCSVCLTQKGKKSHTPVWHTEAAPLLAVAIVLLDCLLGANTLQHQAMLYQNCQLDACDKPFTVLAVVQQRMLKRMKSY